MSEPLISEYSIEEGWLTSARKLLSPNCDQRPEDSRIDLLVIHNISLPPNEYGGPYIDQLFTNQLDPSEHDYFSEIAHLEVSSHLLINREGQVTQYVPFCCRAWHAGQSCFEGKEKCNDFSIGIELEGDDETPFTDVQYEALGQITKSIMLAYPAITQDRITGHSDIAPGRKTDPGPHFDWQRYLALLAEVC